MSYDHLSFEATSELLVMLYADSFLVNLLNIFRLTLLLWLEKISSIFVVVNYHSLILT